jgi:hypothetical protein
MDERARTIWPTYAGDLQRPTTPPRPEPPRAGGRLGTVLFLILCGAASTLALAAVGTGAS